MNNFLEQRGQFGNQLATKFATIAQKCYTKNKDRNDPVSHALTVMKKLKKYKDLGIIPKSNFSKTQMIKSAPDAKNSLIATPRSQDPNRLETGKESQTGPLTARDGKYSTG